MEKLTENERAWLAEDGYDPDGAGKKALRIIDHYERVMGQIEALMDLAVCDVTVGELDMIINQTLSKSS